jgi:hypothetical protein
MQLNKSTFWDCDLSAVDFDKSAGFIVARILMRGGLDEWNEVRKFYGDEKVLQALRRVRYLDKKSLNFVSNFYNIPKEKFRCFNYQQLNQVPWTV